MEQDSTLHETALSYLGAYYISLTQGNPDYRWTIVKRIARVCIKIAEKEKLTATQREQALLASCFRYAGTNGIGLTGDHCMKLLDDFALQTGYPQEDVAAVKALIAWHISKAQPFDILQQTVGDALNYRLAMDDFLANKETANPNVIKTGWTSQDELALLNGLSDEFSGAHFYTYYAKRKYTAGLTRNYNKLSKRIRRLSTKLERQEKQSSLMTDKETEDLFKIAFRNYVKLVDVADSKAALLIHVNSILISVVIGFVISRTEKYPMLIIPSFLTLAVAFLTILLSILASRPQSNSYIKNRASKSYQTFFFGSFDMVGSEFRDADFDSYSVELASFLKSGKENVYNEIYKEVFNVRKVLSKKFTFLSYAYIVFLGGLALSIVSFFIAIK